MKALALMLASFFALGMVAPAIAQAPGSGDQATQASPPAPSRPDVEGKAGVRSEPRSMPPGASGDRSRDLNVNINKRDETAKSDGRDDGGSALPRGAASDRTTIFGLSPTAAVILAAALLVVVILSIVAMTRSGETTYIERDRRL
jgi:hypothetical protein